MEFDNIKLLLDKYWAAETTEAEERYLKDFFVNASDVPDELIAEKQLFMLYALDANYPVPDGNLTTRFQHQLAARIFPFKTLFKYAAVLVLLLGVTFLILKNRSRNFDYTGIQPTINNEQAVKEANMALSLLGENIKDGLHNMEQLKVLEELKINIREKKK
jgi:hypothetical protein